MVQTAAEKIGSAEFRTSATDAMQKIIADKNSKIIKKDNLFSCLPETPYGFVKYIVKAKSGRRVFAIRKVNVNGAYEFVLNIGLQNRTNKFTYGDLEKLYNAVEHTYNTREKIYSTNERKIVRFLSGFTR